MDLAAVLDSVFEEETVDVCLFDLVLGLYVLLLAHDFSKFSLLKTLGLTYCAELISIFFLKSID